MTIQEDSLKLHEQHKGKLEIKSKVSLKTKEDLSKAYTPGVAEPCKKIAENKEDVYKYTIKGNSVAVITDGSAVLGLGNIGPEAALPVMEGKAILFKQFADIDAYPLCLNTQNPKKIIEIVKALAPTFGGINLEDIKAPECFEIEQALQNLGIPVMHDDQHGTAIVVLAALINALKVKKSNKEDVKIIINGAGAAAIAITKLLLHYGFKHITLIDTKGAIYKDREELNDSKKEIAKYTNKHNKQGSLNEVIKDMDIFIGVSKGNVLTKEMIKSMSKEPIIFAMANPIPEIMPEDAKEVGALIMATGRSDFPNQINNVLAFPGVFRGALDIKAKKITEKMKLAAAQALANLVPQPTKDKIIPSPFDQNVSKSIAEAVKNAWLKEK